MRGTNRRRSITSAGAVGLAGRPARRVGAVPSYRVIMVVGALRPGVDPAGVLPAAADAARELGAREAMLVRYGSSGDVTGDPSSVVGNARGIVS